MNFDSRKPRAELRDHLRETVRTSILDAAEELIAAHGLHEVALAQIARKAGVAVGTLYNYFADRDAMIALLFERRRESLRPLMQAARTNGKALAFEPRLRLLMRELLGALESHRRFVKVAVETEYHKRSPSTTAQDLQGAFEEVVAVGVREGVIAKATAPLLTMLLAGAIKSVIMRRIADGGDFVADADPIVSLMLDGARA